MAIAEFHFTAGNSLGRMTSATVLIPEKAEGPYAVLYLLHGRSDDHTAWTRRSNIDRYVENLPLIVVMPNGEKGWYSDALRDPSKQFESYIIKDLIPFVDSSFHTKAEKSGRAVAGLSMGGYGAMKFGLKYPELFAAAHSFSGALDMAQSKRFDSEEHRLIFGDVLALDSDLFALAALADPTKLPKLSFDCGVDDGLLQDCRAFDQHLGKLHIPHSYTEYDGSHNWPYWNEHVLDALPLLLSALGVEHAIDRQAHLFGYDKRSAQAVKNCLG